METISNLAQLKNNLKTFSSYFSAKDKVLHEYALDRIKKGNCFVTFKVNSQIHFAPSRFIGYVNNDMQKHENNDNKDGKKTNPALNKLLSKKPQFNLELENTFINYCNKLGVKPDNRKRTYWNTDLQIS